MPNLPKLGKPVSVRPDGQIGQQPVIDARAMAMAEDQKFRLWIQTQRSVSGIVFSVPNWVKVTSPEGVVRYFWVKTGTLSEGTPVGFNAGNDEGSKEPPREVSFQQPMHSVKTAVGYEQCMFTLNGSWPCETWVALGATCSHEPVMRWVHFQEEGEKATQVADEKKLATLLATMRAIAEADVEDIEVNFGGSNADMYRNAGGGWTAVSETSCMIVVVKGLRVAERLETGGLTNITPREYAQINHSYDRHLGLPALLRRRFGEMLTEAQEIAEKHGLNVEFPEYPECLPCEKTWKLWITTTDELRAEVEEIKARIGMERLYLKGLGVVERVPRWKMCSTDETFGERPPYWDPEVQEEARKVIAMVMEKIK